MSVTIGLLPFKVAVNQKQLVDSLAHLGIIRHYFLWVVCVVYFPSVVGSFNEDVCQAAGNFNHGRRKDMG